jgi:hypothetical protein
MGFKKSPLVSREKGKRMFSAPAPQHGTNASQLSWDVALLALTLTLLVLAVFIVIGHLVWVPLV